jgi:purine nucleosidase
MANQAAKRIWIDTDIAMGASKGDVDDGFALAAVLCAARAMPAQAKIVGISVVTGNTLATTAAVCVESLSLKFGALEPAALMPEAAAKAIAQLLPTTVVLSLGPLSNVAAAINQNPALARHVSVYWVGGVLRPWSIRRRMSDLNVRRDPLAAQLVTKTNSFARQFPLDVIDQLTANAAQLQRIAATGDIGRYLADTSQRWLRYAWLRHGVAAFPVWDLVPALYALDRLPEATFDDKNRLVHFDPKAAWREFEALLANG